MGTVLCEVPAHRIVAAGGFRIPIGHPAAIDRIMLPANRGGARPPIVVDGQAAIHVDITIPTPVMVVIVVADPAAIPVAMAPDRGPGEHAKSEGDDAVGRVAYGIPVVVRVGEERVVP